MSSLSPWWSPDRYADRRPFLLGRNHILNQLRFFFLKNDFVEVDPCVLQTSPGNETHLHAFKTTAELLSGEKTPLYLHTSPEFACKKLLSAGEPKIIAFSHAFRNKERGTLHHPEFLMVEWYRKEENYTQLMDDCTNIVQLAAETTATKQFSFRNKKMDPFAEPERISVADAFQCFANIDLLSTLDSRGNCDAPLLREQLKTQSIRTADDDTWSDLFSRVLVEKIEPHLGINRLTILDRYPSVEAALAQPCSDNPKEAERFELYACGVELANGFGELTNAKEQRKRFEHEMEEKLRIYGETYPIDEDFLHALEKMPAASGIALGFDRLALLATGAQHIEQVLWAPVPEFSQ